MAYHWHWRYLTIPFATPVQAVHLYHTHWGTQDCALRAVSHVVLIGFVSGIWFCYCGNRMAEQDRPLILRSSSYLPSLQAQPASYFNQNIESRKLGCFKIGLPIFPQQDFGSNSLWENIFRKGIRSYIIALNAFIFCQRNLIPFSDYTFAYGCKSLDKYFHWVKASRLILVLLIKYISLHKRT